jgi:hypothetical protein
MHVPIAFWDAGTDQIAVANCFYGIVNDLCLGNMNALALELTNFVGIMVVNDVVKGGVQIVQQIHNLQNALVC